MSVGDRVSAMASRLTDTLTLAGVTAQDSATVLRAYWLAMETRREQLTEHHAALLHPARSALILFHDVSVRDASLLSAASVLDTHQPVLAPSLGAVEAELGSEVARIAGAVPTLDSAGDELLEQLLVAERDVQLAALAERLDFARHLHLITEDNWAQEHELISSVYLPVAVRTNPLLGRRFAWWVDAFGRRRLRA